MQKPSGGRRLSVVEKSLSFLRKKRTVDEDDDLTEEVHFFLLSLLTPSGATGSAEIHSEAGSLGSDDAGHSRSGFR